jgi:hypothetical protein
MANPNVHLFTHDRALANGEARVDRPAGIGGILSRLYGEFSLPGPHGEATTARPVTGAAT